MRKLLLGVSIALAAALAAPAQQTPQLPQPKLYALFPAGARAGSEVEVRISGGGELDRVDRLVFSHPGIASKRVEQPADRLFPQGRTVENRFLVAVKAEVPPGVYEVRAAGPYGISNARRFAVDLREEVLEKEPNNDEAAAQALPFGAVVNGSTEGQGFDVYKIDVKKGRRILVVAQALALDSRAQLSVEVVDPSGRALRRVVGTRTSDPMVDVSAEADGAHLVRLHDLTFRGGDEYGYRLTVGAGPWIDFVDPPAVKAGAESAVTVYGRGLPGGTPVEGLTIDGRPVEKLAAKIAPPADARAGEAFFFPGEASSDVFAWRLGNSNPVRILAVEDAVGSETEPNDAPEQAQALTLPARVAGRLQARGDRDGFAFDAKKGQKLWIEVVGQRLGWPVDPVFVVQSAADGKDLLESDDPAQPQQNRDQFRRLRLTPDDPAALWTVPADGRYRILLRDLYSGAQGDPRFAYVLTVREARPDFALVAFPVEAFPPENRISPWACVLRRGGSERIRVHAFRLEGYDGPIRIEAEGLPPGVTARAALLGAGSPAEELLFHAAADAPAFAGSVTVVGKATLDGKEIVRAAKSAEVVYPVTDQNQQTILPRVVDRIALSVDAERVVPLSVKVADGKGEYRTARGGKLKVALTLSKNADFKDIEKAQVKLVAVGLPGQGNNRPVSAKELTLELGKPNGELEIEVSDKAPTGPTTFFMAGDVQMPYQHEAGLAKTLEEERKRIEGVAKQLADEVKAAEAARGKADADLKKAQEGLEAAKKQAKPEEAEQALRAAQEKVKAAEEAKKQAAAAEADLKALAKSGADELKKLAADAKKAGDAAKEKKVRLAVATLPIVVEVAAAPLSLKLPAERPEVAADGKVEVEVELVREFGFDGEVKLELSGPKLSLAAPAVAAKGVSKLKLTVAAGKDAAAGDVAATLKASLSWNGKTIPFEQAFPLKVGKKAEAKP